MAHIIFKSQLNDGKKAINTKLIFFFYIGNIHMWQEIFYQITFYI